MDIRLRKFCVRLLCIPVVLLYFAIQPANANTKHTADTSRIIGGTPTAAGDWPNIGFLLLDDDHRSRDERLFCGLSLVSSRFLLTAAHCVALPNGSIIPIEEISAVLGTNNVLDQNSMERPILRVYVHPEYNALTSENDIALLELATSADDIEPLPLADFDANQFAGDPALVVGWGATEVDINAGPIAFPTLQQEVVVPLVSRSICNGPFQGIIQVSHLCAGRIQGAVDACQGDSGSALLYRGNDQIYRQVGIISFGVGCARPFLFGVYTNTDFFKFG